MALGRAVGEVKQAATTTRSWAAGRGGSGAVEETNGGRERCCVMGGARAGLWVQRDAELK